jgi:GntR family transcriptional regulator/MocR family aminotransferase
LTVARGTITEAYARLVSEGYVASKRGSGTFVARSAPKVEVSGPVGTRAAPRAESAWARRLSGPRAIIPDRELPFDFRPGLPDLPAFPIAVWRRVISRNLKTLSHDIGRYGDPAGNLALRQAIARYVSHSRAVLCSPENVIITSGAQQALDIVSRLLIEPGSVVALENPAYPLAVGLFRAHGARLNPVTVDDEGLDVEQLAENARCIYVTPSHQFPLGVTMSLARRRSLLQWVRRRQAIIIEDDYDSEFRFGGRPVESLQGLDRSGQVIYLGTFSKVLFPGLRLGYAVVPGWLREKFASAKWLLDRHTSALEQCAMAEFMSRGHFGRYMRQMQRTYGRRREALIVALSKFFGSNLRLLPSHAGLHVAGFLDRQIDSDELIRRAYEGGVGLYSIEPFYLSKPRRGLILGYGACSEADITEGIRRLRGILESLRV